MKELWRRTTVLFWQYPILWLPVLVADLFGFVLRQCVQGLSHSITSWLVQQSHGSVLGGAPDSAQLRTLTFEAIALTAPLKWGSYFATILAYTVALAVIAGLVRQALQGSTPVFRSGLASLAPKAGPALVLAAKVLGLCLAGLALMAIPIWSETLLSPRNFGYLIASVWLVVVAYFSVPLAIRFLQAGTIPNSRTAVTYSRMAAIAGVACSDLLSLFCTQAESSVSALRYQGNMFARTATEACGSLIIALPYIPLFIFLALATSEPEAARLRDENASIIPDAPEAVD